METILFTVLSLSLVSATTEAAVCDLGWVPYKDEFCLKSFSNLLTYDQAKNFCSPQGSELSKSSLVMIKNEEIKKLMANYTKHIFDNIWLGSKYDEEAGKFKWDDGDSLTYTNWVEGYPRNVADSVTCIELRPQNTRHSTNMNGHWANAVCQKRNLVMCQKDLVWAFQDAIGEIKRIRKQLEITEQNLEMVSSKVVPVGSICIEYNNQPSPMRLWPSLTWQDITNTYAGLFFRASGGGAAGWGTVQEGCSPRVNQMQYMQSRGTRYPTSTSIPASGWSAWGHAGFELGGPSFIGEAIRLHTGGCEVRPRNQAVRLWKRTA